MMAQVLEDLLMYVSGSKTVVAAILLLSNFRYAVEIPVACVIQCVF